jgi:tetratricopeptide (TPR) repeat protein
MRALRPPSRPSVAQATPSVLALPCTVYGAPEVAFLTDAVPSTISTLLAQVEGIDTKVPPTSFEAEKVKGDLSRLAELYQVSSFIVTSITTSPGRFALNVQLVDAATRKVRWGQQYEGPRETYNDLARQAADGIRQALRPAALPVPTAGISSEAELAVREGMYYANRYNNLGNLPDFDTALAAFTRALGIAPSFAAAAAKVAMLYNFRFDEEGDAHGARHQAESWARRALGIDPRCGEAWAALCAVELSGAHPDPERGLDYAAKAVAFAPRDAIAHHNLGMWVGGPGSASLFVAAGLQSVTLDPFLLPAAGNSAAGLSFLGRPAEALPVVDRALQVEPDFAWGLIARGFVLTGLGRLEEAGRDLRRSEAYATKAHTGGELGRQIRFVLAVAQRDTATSETLARQILASAFDARADANLVSNAMLFATPALARMGRKDDALRVLEKSVAVGVPPPYDWILVEPGFQSLRGDARFAKVLAASRDGAAMVARVLGEARARGELPAYLEGPLDELVQLLKKPAG